MNSYGLWIQGAETAGESVRTVQVPFDGAPFAAVAEAGQIGRASCRERVFTAV